MNERIKELLLKCQTESIDGHMHTRYVDQDKFAELIIAECAVTIDAWGDSGRFETFGQRLNAHFAPE